MGNVPYLTNDVDKNQFKRLYHDLSSEEQNDVWREFDEQLFYRFNFVWGNHTESLHMNEKRDV